PRLRRERVQVRELLFDAARVEVGDDGRQESVSHGRSAVGHCSRWTCRNWSVSLVSKDTLIVSRSAPSTFTLPRHTIANPRNSVPPHSAQRTGRPKTRTSARRLIAPG